PITADEFREYFQACKPTKSWPEKLAVAFSGGPDSTCLLYLLNKLLSTDTIDYSLPKTLVAITIDHSLQTASSQMTKRCIALANSLQVEHLVLKIPWSTPPFSALPPDGSSFENVAREARYHLLLTAMRREGVAAIAFGHHADDQVETALLRVARGSAEVGAAGMRACRRWGMGFGSGPQNVGWAGQHGMNRWVVRPLLILPKERLVATCRENGLEYIEDPTNFQPDVAIRNRIRHSLESLDSLKSRILLDMASRVSSSANEHGHQQYKSMITKEEEELSIVRLRSAVRAISEFVLSLEDKVTIELANCTRPSPVSTIFLSEDALARVTDNTVRLGMVRRILRYVSPFPWGSPRGEAGRRTSSLQRISDHIWQAAGRPRTKLVAGGGVLWTPMSITRDGTMKLRSGAGSSGEVGWLAARQPPMRRSGARDADAGFVAPELDMKPNPLELDITPVILSAVEQNSEDAVEILYDCRF
ncbi:PP-loop family-domain-containing protein, partial [Phellopilus nigrolimitatus]